MEEQLADDLANLCISGRDDGNKGADSSAPQIARRKEKSKKSHNTKKPQLKQEDERKLAAAFAGKGRAGNDEVLVTKFNIPIHRRDIRLLLPTEWLNDEIINFYLSLLQEYCDRRYSKWQSSLQPAQTTPSSTPPPAKSPALRQTEGTRPTRKAKEKALLRMRSQKGSARAKVETREAEDKQEGEDSEVPNGDGPRGPRNERQAADHEEADRERSPLRCHFFNTFFYPLLLKGGHARVARWTRRVDLMAMDLVIVPIHEHVHWTLATVSPRQRTIAYYDSLQQPNGACVELLRAYLLQEETKKNESENESENNDREKPSENDEKREDEEGKLQWRVGNRAEETPRQMNGSDCGVFACMFARCCALGLPVSVLHQRDMPYYRKLIALEILNAAIIVNDEVSG